MSLLLIVGGAFATNLAVVERHAVEHGLSVLEVRVSDRVMLEVGSEKIAVSIVYGRRECFVARIYPRRGEGHSWWCTKADLFTSESGNPTTTFFIYVLS